MIEQAILHTDGGSRGNPGPSGIGYVILADDGSELTTLSEGGAYIGTATNNEAEYKALLWGLVNAAALDVRHLDIRADSELLVKQIKGEYKVRSEGIKPLFHQAMQALASLESYHIAHVYRENNARADTLANEAMDIQGSVGSFAVAFAAPEDKIEDIGRHKKADSVILNEVKDPSPTALDDIPTPSEVLGDRYSQQSIASFQDDTVGGTMTGIYTLTIKDHFDAAHALVGYPGECRQLHGHTWDIEVTVSGTRLDDVGIVYDFKDLKTDLAKILDDYDHVYLNEVPPFDTINATAENLARIIFERMEQSLPAHITLDEIGVWESPIAKLTYRKA